MSRTNGFWISTIFLMLSCYTAYGKEDIETVRFEDWTVSIIDDFYYVAESEGENSNVVYRCLSIGKELEPPTYFGIELNQGLDKLRKSKDSPEFYTITGSYKTDEIHGYFTGEVDKTGLRDGGIEIRNIRFWESLKDSKEISYSLKVIKGKFIGKEVYKRNVLEVSEKSISMSGFSNAIAYVNKNCRKINS